jgi:hypothetical protein
MFFIALYENLDAKTKEDKQELYGAKSKEIA